MKRLLLVRRSLGVGGTLLLLALFGGLLWFVFREPPEPSYQGEALSYWLSLYSTTNHAQANEAVTHIGTNAIPTLLRFLQIRDSTLKLKLLALAQKQHFIVIRAPPPAWTWNYRAAMGFQALGPEASNAVPALVQIYNRRISMYSQSDVLNAFTSIGPAALPDANPVFLDALTNADHSIRLQAEFAVSQMQAQPDVFVPALVNSLKDPKNAPYIALIIQSLANYGPQAKAAVPALTNLLTNPDFGARRAATNALKQIDPIAAANAGVK